MERQAFRRKHLGRRTLTAGQGLDEIALSGWWCATRPENRKFIDGRYNNGPRIVPTRNLWSGSDSAESGRQYRGMQRLADVANRVWPAIVLVQKAATTREIKQRQAQQRSANPPQSHSARVFARRHRTSLHPYTRFRRSYMDSGFTL